MTIFFLRPPIIGDLYFRQRDIEHLTLVNANNGARLQRLGAVLAGFGGVLDDRKSGVSTWRKVVLVLPLRPQRDFCPIRANF